MTTISASQGIRNYRLVKPYAEPLIRKGIATNLAIRVGRGFVALSGHEELLSTEGRELLILARSFFARVEKKGETLTSLSDHAGALETQLPSVENPQPGLFKILSREKNPYFSGHEDSLIILSIVQGCDSGCVFCVYDTKAHSYSAPFPLIMALANATREANGKITFDFSRSDPMFYRDRFFDADFGDVITNMGAEYIAERPLQTHGWAEGHIFAQPAAEKMRAAGVRITRLTIHFFHKEFLRETVPEEVLEKYAQRFIRAIYFLHPHTIRISGSPAANLANPFLSLDYVEGFFEEHIMPHIPPELKDFELDRCKVERLRPKYVELLPGFEASRDEDFPPGFLGEYMQRVWHPRLV